MPRHLCVFCFDSTETEPFKYFDKETNEWRTADCCKSCLNRLARR